MAELMLKEIENDSNRFYDYINKVNIGFKSLERMLSYYENSLRGGIYEPAQEEDIINGITEMEKLQEANFSYLEDRFARIKSVFIRLNEKYFDLDRSLSDEYLEGRLLLW